MQSSAFSISSLIDVISTVANWQVKTWLQSLSQRLHHVCRTIWVRDAKALPANPALDPVSCDVHTVSRAVTLYDADERQRNWLIVLRDREDF